MRRWPNAPDVFGWLRLDRRGNWLLRTAEGVFERIGNRALNQFIARNYQPDASGRWFFQNGPQRVFVGLECTPWVFRLGDDGHRWLAHTGVPAGTARELLFDERGGALLVTALGAGCVLDRDLAALLDSLRDSRGRATDAGKLLAALRVGRSQHVQLPGARVNVQAVVSAELAGRYGFVPDPGAAHAGQALEGR
jgi:hypothetical protein